MSGSVESNWIVARTKVMQEDYARKNVARQGYTAYLPRCRNDKTGRVSALFPGYLFVRTPERWTWLRNTYGILDVVFGTAGRPAQLPAQVIASIKSREGYNGLVALPAQPRFELGDKVRLNAGAFSGLTGLYYGMSGIDRVKVLLELLGGYRQVTVAEAFVEVV